MVYLVKMSRFRLAILLIFFCSWQTQACESGSQEWLKVDGSLMMALRSNACHYWTWAKANANDLLQSDLLDDEALLTGDPHHENFSYVFSEEKRVYVLDDIDDVGRGPVFLDFLKFLGVTRSVEDNEDELSTEEMLSHYMNGLRGQSWEGDLPKWLEEGYEISQEDYLKDYQNKIDKNTSKGKFKKDDGLIRWKSMESSAKGDFKELEEQYFAKALPEGYEIKDRAIYVKLERGGSLGLIRYLYYLKNGDSEEIIEFKPLPQSSLAIYRRDQLDTYHNAIEALKIYWPETYNEYYKLIKTEQRTYFMRPKLPKYVDYSVNDFEDHPKRFRDLSYYIAHYLGQQHGKQLQNKHLAEVYLKSSQQMISQSQKFVEKYLDAVKKEND